MFAASVLLFVGFVRAAIKFTGNVETDFVPSPTSELVALVTKVDGSFGGQADADVGVPPAWPYPTTANPRSGWDIKELRLAYDYEADQLHIGINCFDVCGDADGDGDASRSSNELVARGGIDLPDLQNSEAFAVAFDLSNDGVMDFVVGVPSETNGKSERYPCGNMKLDVSCFGIYLYDTDGGAQVPSQRFIYRALSDVATHPARDNNPQPNAAKPDLEWTILNFNKLRQSIGVPALDRRGAQPWSLNFLAFGGSFQDDGVGEDQFPNNAPFERAEFPCVAFDECGVCGGDGKSCAGCDGVANSGRRYDRCGVCGGDDSLDCTGVACGTSRYDVCGVCNGDGKSCAPPRAVCSEEFGNVCKFHPGDVWKGSYRDSEYDKLLAGDPVLFTFAPNNYVMETNELGTHWDRFIITDNYVAVQEFTHFPERVNRSCNVDDLAKYKLLFSADCRTAEIVAIIEPCRRREALFNNMRIELQKATEVNPSECSLWQGSSIWQAKYHERVNAWTGQNQIGTFTFAPQNRAVVESSDSAVYFYTWSDESVAAAPQEVRMTDRGSQDFAQACKTPDIGGLYTLQFSHDCSRAMTAWPSDKPADKCAQRALRLDELVLIRVPMPKSSDNDTPCRAACAARLASANEVDECAHRCESFGGHKAPAATTTKATPTKAPSHNNANDAHKKIKARPLTGEALAEEQRFEQVDNVAKPHFGRHADHPQFVDESSSSSS